MAALLLTPVIIFFFGMGLMGLIAPQMLLDLFMADLLGANMRNEVRAVYGGYGILVGLMLIYSFYNDRLRPGIRAAIALSLGGMAIGRSISLVMEPVETGFPIIVLILEIAMAILIAMTTRRQSRHM